MNTPPMERVNEKKRNLVFATGNAEPTSLENSDRRYFLKTKSVSVEIVMLPQGAIKQDLECARNFLAGIINHQATE